MILNFARPWSIFLYLGLGTQAFAVSTQFSYSCLGIDGVPISVGSALDSTCCSNGQLVSNPPANCRAGFNSIGASAASGAALSVNLAQNTLDSAKQMSGAQVAYGDPPSTETGTTSTTGGPSIMSALTSASGTSVGTGVSRNAGVNPILAGQNGAAASGLGSGSAGSLGAGGAMALGNSGSSSDSAKNLAVVDPNSNAPAGINYVNAGGAGTGSADKTGLAGLNFGSLLGRDGTVGKDGSGANPEIKFAGSGSSGEGGTEDGKNGADSVTSATIDPADYFMRIDKRASIFKIVSNRYTQESLKKHVGHFENPVEK